MVKRIGWFDAFRDNGGPTWYGENRTPVVTDTTTVGILAIFVIFLIAFLIILPGIRKERWSSFCSVLLTLIIGSLILVCLYHPCWHVGEVRVHTAYRAFSSESLDAVLGVRVGLRYVNITLVDEPMSHSGHSSGASGDHNFDNQGDESSTTQTTTTSRPPLHHGLHYNERFLFNEVKSMERELHNSLHKGLPFPILRVIEYLSVDRAGFIWGRQYRVAGYYTSCLLWLCLALWTLQVAMLCLVPQYFTRMVISVGAVMLAAVVCYALYTPADLLIRFPGPGTDANAGTTVANLRFGFGWCFWSILAAGAFCFVCGTVVRTLEVKQLYRFATFLQTDFDEVAASSAARRSAAATAAAAGTSAAFGVDVRNGGGRVDSVSSPLPSPDPSPMLERRAAGMDEIGGGGFGARLHPDAQTSSMLAMPPVDPSKQQRRFTFGTVTDDEVTMTELPPKRKSNKTGSVTVLKIGDGSVTQTPEDRRF